MRCKCGHGWHQHVRSLLGAEPCTVCACTAFDKPMTLHCVAHDLRRYKKASIAGHPGLQVTGSKTAGYTLWTMGPLGQRTIVDTFKTLEALLEAL